MSHAAHLGHPAHTTMIDGVRLDEPHQVQRYQREMEVLASIGRLLATQSGQQQILSEVLAALEPLGMVRGTIMLLSADGRELVVEAAEDCAPPQGREVRYRSGEGVIGAVIESGLPAVIPRISQEPRFQNRIYQRRESEAADASFICVPIAAGSEVVGTLSADLPLQSAELLEEQSRFLGIVASMIAYDVKARRMEEIHRQHLEAENLRLRSALGENFRPENIIGNSHAIRDVYLKIQQVAPTDTTVLVRGESGTGKELVASAIHYGSPRAARPLVKVNCAALSENLLESELFGHEAGAFTGALHTRIGRIEEADGGTLFLDEIGDFSPATQVKLLRVLQEREFERVGSNKTRKANVRIIAATNRNLETAVEQSAFRQDLYYRINVFPLVLPPLRDRRDDILLLADHFVEKYSKKLGKTVRRISTPAINMMFAYHWPGNVRELENCVEYAVLLSVEGVIHGHSLPPTLQMPEGSEPVARGALKTRVELLEKDIIIDALKFTRGNVSAAARQLGISARMMRYKVKKLKIDFREFCKKDAS